MSENNLLKPIGFLKIKRKKAKKQNHLLLITIKNKEMKNNLNNYISWNPKD